jgi:hypothetical protein
MIAKRIQALSAEMGTCVYRDEERLWIQGATGEATAAQAQ